MAVAVVAVIIVATIVEYTWDAPLRKWLYAWVVARDGVLPRRTAGAEEPVI